MGARHRAMSAALLVAVGFVAAACGSGGTVTQTAAAPGSTAAPTTFTPSTSTSTTIAASAGSTPGTVESGAPTGTGTTAPVVRVLVATTEIPRGTPGDGVADGAYARWSAIPEPMRPSTAVTDAASLRGTVARFDIAAGTVLVAEMFVAP